MTNFPITTRPAHELALLMRDGQLSSTELTRMYLDRIEALDGELNAFVTVDAKGAIEQARQVDDARAAGKELGPLAGIPVALKDNICTQGIATTCGSKMLAGWVPPYDAGVVDRLRQAGLVIVGKTNMDEFAMGSSTETSAFGPTKNPWDPERSPGGSGGGSAAAVAASLVPLALGSDTGGSIRGPAAYTGTVGVKPTYGGVSRYGIVAAASSLDQAGPVARTVLDAALLHQVIGGHDPRDSTSLPGPTPDLAAAAQDQDVSGLRVGILQPGESQAPEPGVLARFDEAVAVLKEAGLAVSPVSCPSFEHALGAYLVLVSAELSSNLARLDAMRYGLRVGDDGEAGAEQVMSLSRGKAFGKGIKRRVLFGTHVLSSDQIETVYKPAQRVRRQVTAEFDAAFEKYDVLISPTTVTPAFKLQERQDPIAMAASDGLTVSSNLAGNASASIPAGLTETGLPVGLQIIAPRQADDRLYRLGAYLEGKLQASWGGSLLQQLPEPMRKAVRS